MKLTDLPGVNFTLPSALPSGQYLVRMEAIALHVAETYGGAQFYISCGQVNVLNGGDGTPGPLVAIPGVYTGYEPGILINIYDPIPTNYTQPGPVSLSFLRAGALQRNGADQRKFRRSGRVERAWF